MTGSRSHPPGVVDPFGSSTPNSGSDPYLCGVQHSPPRPLQEIGVGAHVEQHLGPRHDDLRLHPDAWARTIDREEARDGETIEPKEAAFGARTG